MFTNLFAKKDRTVLVVGTFRSGTNLLKHLLTENYRAEVLFSRWFWKHGIPPTQIQVPVPDSVPIVVVTKNPIDLNPSLYRFWRARRRELDIGRNLSEFVRRPFKVYDNTNQSRDPQYLFATPTDYWNQFHHAWINWTNVDDRRSFVALEDILADPDATLRSLAERSGLQRKSVGPIALPEEPVGTSGDGTQTVLGAYQNYSTERLSEADRDAIKNLVYQEIAQRLGYTELCS